MMIWFLLVQVVILTVFVVLVARRTAETDKSLLGVMASVDDLCKRVKRGDGGWAERPKYGRLGWWTRPSTCPKCVSSNVIGLPEYYCLDCGAMVPTEIHEHDRS